MSKYQPTPREALQAIKARVEGVYNHPALRAYGPLDDVMVDTIRGIADAGLAYVETEKQKSVIPLEWFMSQLEAFVAPDEQLNMASVAAHGKMARHLYGNQPGFYITEKTEGAER